PFKVDDAEALPEVPVRQGREVVAARRALGPDDDVARLVVAHRHILGREVRHFEEERFELGLNRPELVVEGGNRLAEDLAPIEEGLPVGWGSPADLAAEVVSLSLEVVGLLDVFAPETVELEDALDGRLRVAVGDRLADAVRVLADELE